MQQQRTPKKQHKANCYFKTLKISIRMEFRRFRHTIPSKIQQDSKSPADWVAGLHIAMNGNSLKSGKVAKQGVTQRLWRLHTFVHFMPHSTDLEGRVCGRVKCSGNKLSWGEGKTEETETQRDANKCSWRSSGNQTVQLVFKNRVWAWSST